MDLIIPYQRQRDDRQLSWAVSGFRIHLKGLGNIFIIGDDPKLPDTIHVPFKDGPNIKGKQKNIYQKVIRACNDPRVSDSFLFANDDHYLLQDYNIATFPNYYSLLWPEQGSYAETTVEHTRAMGIIRNFDIHCPIIYNKQKFIAAFEDMHWPAFGYCIKSVYAERNSLPGTHMADNKMHQYEGVIPRYAPWFSTGDRVFGPRLIQEMNELYGAAVNH